MLMPIIIDTIVNVVRIVIRIITLIIIAILFMQSISVVVIQFPDFGKSLGLPDLSELKDVFQFNMKSITLEKILDFLEEIGETELKEDINKVLREVQVGHRFIVAHMLLCCFMVPSPESLACGVASAIVHLRSCLAIDVCLLPLCCPPPGPSLNSHTFLIHYFLGLPLFLVSSIYPSITSCCNCAAPIVLFFIEIITIGYRVAT